jgi:hypothetical protein
MDLKIFHDGLISASLTLETFSLTLILEILLAKQNLNHRSLFLIMLLSCNMLFCTYNILEGTRIKRIFKLENKNILKFVKRIGIINLIYTPHMIIYGVNFYYNIDDSLKVMAFLTYLLEIVLIVLIYKEVYDILLKNQLERNFDLSEDRALYLGTD